MNLLHRTKIRDKGTEQRRDLYLKKITYLRDSHYRGEYLIDTK